MRELFYRDNEVLHRALIEHNPRVVPRAPWHLLGMPVDAVRPDELHGRAHECIVGLRFDQEFARLVPGFEIRADPVEVFPCFWRLFLAELLKQVLPINQHADVSQVGNSQEIPGLVSQESLLGDLLDDRSPFRTRGFVVLLIMGSEKSRSAEAGKGWSCPAPASTRTQYSSTLARSMLTRGGTRSAYRRTAKIR